MQFFFNPSKLLELSKVGVSDKTTKYSFISGLSFEEIVKTKKKEEYFTIKFREEEETLGSVCVKPSLVTTFGELGINFYVPLLKYLFFISLNFDSKDMMTGTFEVEEKVK